jgi:hypothetical protein
MRVTRISVAIEKRANDGDYGSERSQAELSADLEPGDDAIDCLQALMMQARTRIMADLGESPNLRVRRALVRELRRCSRCHEPLSDAESYTHQACDEADRAERDERRAKQNAEWESRRAQQAEDLVADEMGVEDEEPEDDADDGSGPDENEDQPLDALVAEARLS